MLNGNFLVKSVKTIWKTHQMDLRREHWLIRWNHRCPENCDLREILSSALWEEKGLTGFVHFFWLQEHKKFASYRPADFASGKSNPRVGKCRRIYLADICLNVLNYTNMQSEL